MRIIEGRFADKIALITGASSGIGEATARLFAAEGAKLLLVDINAARGQKVADTIGPEKAIFVKADVSIQAEVEAAVAAAVKHYGRIDILFNNAAIGCFGNTLEVAPEDWLKVFAVDLHSIYYACRAAIPSMLKPGGVIVNTASISGLGADLRLTAYNAAKGAVVNYTRSLAIDHASEGIRTNALCPGLIDTPMTSALEDKPAVKKAWLDAIPMGRAGKPEEMAQVVAFLASDAASYVNGAILAADGGLTAWNGTPRARSE